MKETNEMKEKIIDILQNDPLYAVLRDTPLEETLYTDPYLANIIEKKFYSTLEVASWFNITDAQLRNILNRSIIIFLIIWQKTQRHRQLFG